MSLKSLLLDVWRHNAAWSPSTTPYRHVDRLQPSRRLESPATPGTDARMHGINARLKPCGKTPVPFFVVVRMHARSGRLTDVLTLIQREFDRSQAQGSGRRRGRLFQRLGDPTDLLGVVEWDSETSYAAYRTTTTHQAILDSLSGPSHARYCRRLTLWERMYQQAAVTACALIDGDPSGSDEIASFLTRMGRAEMLSSPGIISHEVYRTRKQPASYIVVHQWKRLADLEAFRAEVSPRHETVLNDFGATIERFTGRLAASSPVE